MCPADNIYQPAMADIIWSYGIRELVVIQRGDSYGDGFMILMKPEFDRLGGKMAGPIIRYPIETANFTEYLKQGEAQALEALNRNGNDTSKVGVLLLALDEASSILKQTSSYRALYDLVWFGGDSTARSQNILHEAPLEASHVKLFSPLLPEPATREYEDLGTRFKEATGSDFGIYYAYLYDTAGAIAKTILDTGTDNATKVTAAFPEVCINSYGASGWLRLNEFGDRSPPTLNIWCYNSEPSTPSKNILAGEYNIDTGATVWNTKIRD
jgi:branched-chain amino acid transport system substrate-binding protein